MREKGPVPLRYWALWWAILVVADFVFYILLTPIWIGLRVVVVRGVTSDALSLERAPRTNARASAPSQLPMTSP